MDRGEKNNRPRNRFKGKRFSCERKGRRAEESRSAKKMEKSGVAAADKKGGRRGKFYSSAREEYFVRRHCGLRRSLEHRTRDCEERGAEKA